MTADLQAIADALSDRYRIVRELGAGGMATVFLANDLKHQRQVALKVLRDDLTASLGKDRFLREVTIAASLTHPHVVALYDSGEAAGNLFYVMPFVEGQSLRQKLIHAGELPIPDAVRVLRDVADGIAYAHQRGVVHRDLKPENVMLTGRHAMVTDFGVAKAVSEATGRQSITTVGIALGTPAYMSPEQATADPHTDARSDIYSFGVLAYELLTGQPPFTGDSPQQVLAAHVTTAAHPVTLHRPSIPPALAGLVMKCLEKKPADRFQSAEELIPILESVLTPSGGLNPAARLPEVAPAGIVPLIRRPWVLLSGAVALSVLGVLGFRAMARRSGDATARPKLAVMPLETRSPDSLDALLAEGLAEQIGVRLSRVPALQVLSASAVGSQWRKTPDALQAANALGAGWVVTGSLRRVGDEVSALIEVVDTRSGVRRWSGSFPRTRATLSTLEAAVAESVQVALAGRSITTSASVVGARGAANPEAYRLVLLGNALLGRRTEESVKRAIGYYAQSTQLDSTFAMGWARLSLAYSVAATWDAWNLGVPHDSLVERARLAGERAIALDSTLAAGWLARGQVATARLNWATAIAAYDKALRLDSLDAETYHMYGYLYGPAAGLQDFAAAEPLFRRALALDPNRPNTWRLLAQTRASQGQFGEAEAKLDTALALGDWTPARVDRSFYRFLSGNGAGALSDLSRAGLDSTALDYIGAMYRTATGDTQTAEKWLEQHALPKSGGTLSGEDVGRIIAVANMRMALGRRSDAVLALEQLPNSFDKWIVLHGAMYIPLRKEARFQAMLDKNRPAFLSQR